MGFKDFFKKKKIDERIVNLEVERSEKIERAHEQGRYSFFENDFAKEFFEKCMKANDYDRYVNFYNMVDSWDETCTLSMDAGQYVANLWKEDIDKIPALRRENFGEFEYEDGIPSSKYLDNVLNKGMVNNSFGEQGVRLTNVPTLGLILSPLDNFTGMVNLLSPYKSSNSIVIFQFPRLLVGKDLSFTSDQSDKEIYNNDDGIRFIKPEYIVGVIVKNDNGFDKFYSREELLKNTLSK